MERKREEVVAKEEETPARPRFTEAQRGNLTRLIQGSRFSVVSTELSGQKITGKPVG